MATYIPVHNVPIQFMDNNGDPLESGTLSFYEAGTTTTTDLYSDSSGTSIGTSITLNAWGFPESGGSVITLFRDQSKAIKIIGKNSSGTEVFTSDNIPATAAFDTTASDKLSNIEASADVTDATNVGAVVNGQQEKFISAEQLFPATTNGCAANATVEVTAQYPEVRGLAFDGTSKEYAQFVVALPKRWDASTVTAQVYWTSAATDADSVVWGVQAQSYADGDLVGSATNAWGAAKEVTDAMGSAAYKMYRTSETGEITIAGSPADNEFQFFQVYRDPTNPSDTATEDAILMGVKLRWDSDVLNDD